MKTQRYTPSYDTFDEVPYMEDDACGDYVRWDDVEPVMKKWQRL